MQQLVDELTTSTVEFKCYHGESPFGVRDFSDGPEAEPSENSRAIILPPQERIWD